MKFVHASSIKFGCFGQMCEWSLRESFEDLYWTDISKVVCHSFQNPQTTFIFTLTFSRDVTGRRIAKRIIIMRPKQWKNVLIVTYF
jgi:hypothetical protein